VRRRRRREAEGPPSGSDAVVTPFLRRTSAIAHKEVLHILRDARAIYLALGLPVVMLMLFGYGISQDVDHVAIAIADDDRTPASRRLSEALVAGGDFVRAVDLGSPDDAEAAFRSGRARAVLVVPRGYGRDLARGLPVSAQLLVDGSDGTTAMIAIGDAAGIMQATSAARAVRASVSQGPRVRVRFNPAMRSTYNMVSGVIVLILAMVASLLASLTIAREWERGTMEQLFATPVRRLEVVAGKLVPYAGLGLVQTLLVITLGSIMFDVPIRGSLVTLFLASVFFVLAMLGTGLLASIVAKSQLVAVQFAMLISYMPVAMLSGFMFPIANMPWWLRGISMAVPGRYYLTTLRGVLLKGNGLDIVARDLAALVVFAVALLALAVWRFRRRLA
jgi:ABC-2 type transport system permease protein